jgi:hypothetical protein
MKYIFNLYYVSDIYLYICYENTIKNSINI